VAQSFVSVLSGATTSTPFTLYPANHPVAVQCSSASTGEVRISFAQTSGTGPFAILSRMDGSGFPYSVVSGGAERIGIVTQPPTPWGRIELAVAAIDTRSFTLSPLNRL
jgi:hypothetical protein